MADQIYMDRRSAGKGDSPRPVENTEKFRSEWDRIFAPKPQPVEKFPEKRCMVPGCVSCLLLEEFGIAPP